MYKRVLGRYRLQQELLRSQHKTPQGSRNASYLCDRNKAWVDGQKREAMRKKERSELITY